MFNTKEEFKYEFSKRIIESYGRTVEEAHLTEKFMVLETMVRDYASVNWAMTKMAVQAKQDIIPYSVFQYYRIAGQCFFISLLQFCIVFHRYDRSGGHKRGQKNDRHQ
mgnify:CR=1 FL=1